MPVIKIEKQEIQRIELVFVNSYCGELKCFEVGKFGVTAITPEEATGEFCMIRFYRVWKGENIFCDVYQYGFVFYKD